MFYGCHYEPMGRHVRTENRVGRSASLHTVRKYNHREMFLFIRWISVFHHRNIRIPCLKCDSIKWTVKEKRRKKQSAYFFSTKCPWNESFAQEINSESANGRETFDVHFMGKVFCPAGRVFLFLGGRNGEIIAIFFFKQCVLRYSRKDLLIS